MITINTTREELFYMLHSREHVKKEIHNRWLSYYPMTMEQSLECERMALDELNGYNVGKLEQYVKKIKDE